MTNSQIQDAETTIFESIRTLLSRREAAPPEITIESDLHLDLELDSLELAELSAMLEDALGSDPYSEGIIPNTVGGIADFYRD